MKNNMVITIKLKSGHDGVFKVSSESYGYRIMTLNGHILFRSVQTDKVRPNCNVCDKAPNGLYNYTADYKLLNTICSTCFNKIRLLARISNNDNDY